jgi:hypothetical protein
LACCSLSSFCDQLQAALTPLGDQGLQDRSVHVVQVFERRGGAHLHPVRRLAQRLIDPGDQRLRTLQVASGGRLTQQAHRLVNLLGLLRRRGCDHGTRPTSCAISSATALTQRSITSARRQPGGTNKVRQGVSAAGLWWSFASASHRSYAARRPLEPAWAERTQEPRHSTQRLCKCRWHLPPAPLRAEHPQRRHEQRGAPAGWRVLEADPVVPNRHARPCRHLPNVEQAALDRGLPRWHCVTVLRATELDRLQPFRTRTVLRRENDGASGNERDCRSTQGYEPSDARHVLSTADGRRRFHSFPAPRTCEVQPATGGTPPPAEPV